MFRKFGLKNRLLVSFLLVTCIAGIATTLFSIHYFSAKIEEEASDTLRKHMQVAELVFQNKIEAVQNIGESLSRDGTLQLLLNLKVRPKLELYLDRLLSSGEMHEMLAIDTGHKILARAARGDLAAVEHPTLLHNELVTRALRSGRAVSAVEKIQAAGKPLVLLSAAVPVEQSRKIKSGDEAGETPAELKEYIGVVMVRQVLTGNQELGREINQLLGVNVTVFHDGIVTTDGSYQAGMSAQIAPQVYADVMGEGSAGVARVNIFSGDKLSNYRAITNLFGEPVAVLEISTDATPYIDTIRGAVLSLSLVTLACIVVAFSIGYLLARSILVPVEKLLNGVNRVTSGDLAYEIKLEQNDELGHLASSFNSMAKELNGLFGTLETRVLRATKDLQDTLGYLDAIIDNMADGLVVSDTDGKITRYNPAFAAMLPDTSGLRNSDYRSLLQGQLPAPPSTEERTLIQAREAEVLLPGQRIAKAVATSIFQSALKGGFPEYLGSVTLLRDITREKEMDDMLKNTVDTLTLVGTSLSSETNIAHLLEMVVEEACRVTNTDGGTLYTVKEGKLHFEIIRNDSMNIRMGGASGAEVAVPPLAIDESSIAGWVAVNQQVAYVRNLAESTEFDFTSVRRYDASTGYRTRALLVAPMIGRNNDTVGVLQLINPLDPDAADIIELTKNQMDIVFSFASQAAVALENVRSHEKIERKNKAFERFVPTEFIRFLGKTEVEEIKLGEASAQFMSVLFSDIRSFTERSETMTPEENFNFLNRYLDMIGPRIAGNGGFIDKYIGDAIMALFSGAVQGVADDAVAASIGMISQLERLNYKMLSSGQQPVEIGVGIHTGDLTLGTIGFEGRMESTVIGDTVNLASRMEGLTKLYGIHVAISEATYNNLSNPEDFMLREIDTVLVKGKAKPTRVYEVFDGDPADVREYKLNNAARYQEALAGYKAGRWDDAIGLFQEMAAANSADRVAAIYLQRCLEFKQTPPAAEGWNGVTKLTEK